MITLRADLHTHTVASGHAYSTIKEMAESAAGKGLELIAMTDHAPAMPGSCSELHFANLGAVPRVTGGVTILRGVELNVIDMDGTVDLPERLIKRMDWVIASLHENILRPSAGADYTGLYMALAGNPLVDMIGHPNTPAYPFDMDEVIPALAKRGKIIEINDHHIFDFAPGDSENVRRMVSLCAKHGAMVAVNSDAHTCWDVGRTARGVAMLNEMDFPEELVLNVSAGRVLDFVRNRHPQTAL